MTFNIFKKIIEFKSIFKERNEKKKQKELERERVLKEKLDMEIAYYENKKKNLERLRDIKVVDFINTEKATEYIDRDHKCMGLVIYRESDKMVIKVDDEIDVTDEIHYYKLKGIDFWIYVKCKDTTPYYTEYGDHASPYGWAPDNQFESILFETKTDNLPIYNAELQLNNPSFDKLNQIKLHEKEELHKEFISSSVYNYELHEVNAILEKLRNGESLNIPAKVMFMDSSEC